VSKTGAALRLGIVGLGFMGRRYARFVAGIEGLRIAGVCDVDERLAREVAAEHGVPAYGDPGALAAAPDVAAVIVCTPEDRHADPAMAAIAAGKPVMIEKPIAHSLDAARMIAAEAARRSVPLLVAHLLRFEPRWVAARQRLDAGAIGDVVSITTRRIGNILDQQVLRGRTTIPLYYGVHDLDVMRWYAGAEATSITATRRAGALQAAGYDVDDVYTAVLTFANGVLGTAELGWHVPASAVAAPMSGVAIVGTKGAIRIEQGETGFECWNEDGLDRGLEALFWQDAYGIPGGALGLEIRHFAACVRGEAEPAISPDDAVEALRLSLAMEAAAERGVAVDLTSFRHE
jgi:myo-inositol 2-dehydrogenase/D-chiro-inositol 1-dehydrogenase